MPPTLDLARRLLALAQSGLHFTHDPYDKQRYEEIARIASDAGVPPGSLVKTTSRPRARR